MPILRTFVRAALVLIVSGVLMCGLAIGSGTVLESRIFAVTLRSNASSHIGLLDMNTRLFYVYPFNSSVWFSGANWSPNGRYVLAFEADNTTDVLDTQTGSFVQITNVRNCDWSPDNYRLACSDKSDNSIWVITRDLSQRYLVSDIVEANSIEWSPDGQAVAFAVYDGASSQVYLSQLDTDSSRPIAQFSKEVTVGAFSPNGCFLTAYFTDGEKWGTYIIDLHNLTVFSLNHDLGLSVDRVSQAAWSPDSNYLAFQVVTHLDAYYNYGPLYISDVGSFTSLRLAENGIRPQWSPDGSEIVFESPEPINSQSWQLNLYVAALNGTEPRLITDSGWNAVWINNEQIAFSSEGMHGVNLTDDSQIQLLSFPRSQSQFIFNFALWR